MSGTRAAAAGVWLLGTIGCGGDTDRAMETPATVLGDDNLVRPQVIVVKGCLTAAGNRFVLTDLDPGVRGPRLARREDARAEAAAVPTTETYRLVGAEDQLRSLVGQRVEVTGSAEPEKVVEVRESSPAIEPRAARGDETPRAEPRVSTLQTTRLEIGDLRVNSIAGVGERCPGLP